MDTQQMQEMLTLADTEGVPVDPQALAACVMAAVDALDRGTLRVATEQGGRWQVHAWVRGAILRYFGLMPMRTEAGAHGLPFHDKLPLKRDLVGQGVRLVPPGAVRYGAHLEPGCVVMPAYVNIGAYVGAGSMVDTWATVGSCAQIGRGVHLSGGVGIGGVLEPAQAAPVIVEDGAFVGSRCVIVEGVHVERGAVLGAGLVLTASTPIVDVTGPQEVVLKGRVPAYRVVVPGVRPCAYPSGTYGRPCALIVGERSARTDARTSLNEALRDFGVAV